MSQPRLSRHADLFVLINRLLVRLRAAGPFPVGLPARSWLHFTVLNLIGAAVWSCTVAWAGYVIGEGLKSLLGDLRRAEKWIFGEVLMAIALLLAVRHLLCSRRG